MSQTLFGNNVAEKCLLYIANYGEGYINGIAKTFEIAPSQVQKQLVRLEEGDILVSRMLGNSRIFSFNPRLGFKKELEALLERQLSLLSKEETQKYYRNRTRPRKTGKEL